MVDIVIYRNEEDPIKNEARCEKTGFCIYENKDANQLRGDREADQRLCSRYTDSTIFLLHKSEISSLCASSVAVQQQFVSDLVGNPEDRFSRNEAQIRAHKC